MRKLALLLLICGAASAQTFISPSGAARRFVRVNGVPASCAAGDVMVDISVSPAVYYNCPVATPVAFGAGGSGLATDGSSVGATAQPQVFTNGVTTTATTGKVGIGMTPVAMLDVTAPSTLDVIQAVGTQPAAVASGNGATGRTGLAITAPAGGDTSHTQANRTGGQGGAVTIATGAGGQQTGASSGSARGGIGGQLTANSGNGGAATAVTGTVKGGNGGLISINTGGGGASATSNGGAGGAAAIGGGTGGTSTAAAVSGKGGSISLTGGSGGGNSNAAGTAGDGGDINIAQGSAGSAFGGAAAGANGTLTLGLAGATTHILGTISGNCTLNGGATATCTATVPSTCTAPVCTYNSASTPHTIACSVTSTTLTAVSATTLDGGVVNYWCP